MVFTSQASKASPLGQGGLQPGFQVVTYCRRAFRLASSTLAEIVLGNRPALPLRQPCREQSSRRTRAPFLHPDVLPALSLLAKDQHWLRFAMPAAHIPERLSPSPSRRRRHVPAPPKPE